MLISAKNEICDSKRTGCNESFFLDLCFPLAFLFMASFGTYSSFFRMYDMMELWLAN